MRHAMRKGVGGGIDIGLALAGDVVGRAVRRRGDRHRQAALHRDALAEAHQLDRDLALVVVHRDDGLVLAVARLQEDRVGRERADDRHALARCSSATAGAMMSISSRPQVPPSPLCGLKPATATCGAAMPLACSER